MSEYCYVQNDAVVTGPRPLPVTWTDPNTGNQYSNLPALSDPELLALGWYPYFENDPGRPGYYYYRQLSAFQINPLSVTRDVTYEQWEVETVRQDKNRQLENQLPQYTTNEQAINPKVSEYINDDAKWLADEQARLARLTDWDSVASFDTTKPMVLALPNSFVGAKNVRQGVALTAQNKAAVDSGLSEIWNQTSINSYVSANQLAADDSSNATSPTKPGFELRQGLANVSEVFSRIVIWRFDVEGEIDPNLDRSMAMRITNRQDSRDIFTFIYTNAGATYLGFKKFVEVRPGIWEWRLEKETGPGTGDGSIMIWVDSDIAFVLSYIDNPAVQEQWFTDQIQFPAGVEEDNILVAWDPV